MVRGVLPPAAVLTRASSTHTATCRAHPGPPTHPSVMVTDTAHRHHAYWQQVFNAMMEQRVHHAATNPTEDGDTSKEYVRSTSNILAEMDWSAFDGG